MDKDASTATERAQRDQALFDTIAEAYCQKDSFDSSRIARRHRLLQTLKPYSTSRAEKPDVLEVGCGAGFSAQYLRGQYSTYTGIDYSGELIRYARSMFETDDALFHAEDFHDYAPLARYDIIMMIGVLHHMTDVQTVLRKCLSLLKPGGSLIANEPQPDNPLIHVLRRIRAGVDSGYSAEQDELSSNFLIGEYQKAGFHDVTSYPQGLFSTPLAEVVLKPQFFFRPVSNLACTIDGYLERRYPELIRKLAWNTIVCGKNSTA